CQGWSLAEVLRCFGGQGDQAGDGASDFGAQDRRNHFGGLEERSKLRRQTSETTNSLSVSGIRSIPWDSSWRWQVGFLRHSGSRGVSAGKLDCACLGQLSLTSDPSPPRITRNSHGPRVPNRTLVAT